MAKKKYRWGTMVPLIGGSAVGCSIATGTTPQFHFSFDGFEANDVGILNYWKDKKIPYYHIDSQEVPLTEKRFQNIDFVNSVCPCAALARLNTSKGEKVGGNAPQNQWMYKSAEFILEKIQPKVYWGENAPALNMDAGKPVVKNLMEIGKKYGYSFSIYKTSTILHGLPQKRDRCFYFFWKGDNIPIFNFYDRERQTYEDFLLGLDKSMPDMDKIIKDEKPTDFLPFKYLIEHSGLSYSEYIKSKSKDTVNSVMGEIFKSNSIDEVMEWIRKNYPEQLERIGNKRTTYEWLEYVKRKWEDDKGVFYMGPLLIRNYAPAVISKNNSCMIHPTEDRYLSLRELACLMGLPGDFGLENEYTKDGEYPNYMIGQNVPVNAARDMAIEVCRFIDGDKTLKYVTVENGYFLQNNLNKTMKEVTNEKTKKLF